MWKVNARTKQMAYLEEGSEAMVALEAMVDRVGMANVLYALAHICWAKAEHLETNGQDKASAYLWRTGGNNLSSFLLVDSAMTDLQHNQT
jgi:hypothetical protein